MPVVSLKNQYRGVNAHLHSALQHEGSWPNFHAQHIVFLNAELLKQLLPLGYISTVEESLQIRQQDVFGTTERPARPDILVSEGAPARPSSRPSTYGEAILELEHIQQEVVPLVELLGELRDEPLVYRAVSIRRLKGEGEPVAWVELLSPGNKGDHSDALAYRDKRQEVLEAGVAFVEIDYLHETPATFPRLPVYPRAPKSSAYRIVVVNPRPSYQEGSARVAGFGVDVSLPKLPIPLSDDLSIDFDFGPAYGQTFTGGGFGYHGVDYAALPAHFERYRPDDQVRVARRMVAVLEAASRGLDLETGPFEPPQLDLDAALARIEALRSTAGGENA